jgi:hypothetical protein
MPAAAQFYPAYRDRYGNYVGRDYGYDGWGGYGYNAGSSSYNAAMAAASANQIANEQAAAQQRAAMRNRINSTLAADAQQRAQAIQGRQQSSRDWWFQTEQQQLARQQADDARYNALRWQSSGSPAAGMGFEASISSSAAAAANDVIQWPPILRNAQFSAERARVEAPYLRVPKTIPTVDDYQAIIQASSQMKVILKNMAADISAKTYLDAVDFLDLMAAQARGYIEKARKPAA